MKKNQLLVLIILVLVFSTFGCKKIIDDIKEQTITNAITNGVWYVSKYEEGSNNLTSIFSGWDAVFLNNGTFTLSKVGETTATGIWLGNINDWTFTITFNGTPTSPLEKLGGVWTVTRAVSENKGSYSKTVSGVVYNLDMTKRP
ncbi:MAG: hypothetical protein LC122_05515 [Chitinophagales bacterium]|nr:hypothetical protein [Chitinophagales bacterium]